MEFANTVVKEYVWKLPKDMRAFHLELVEFFRKVLEIAGKEEDPIHIKHNVTHRGILEANLAALLDLDDEHVLWASILASAITIPGSIDNKNDNSEEKHFIKFEIVEKIKKCRRELARYNINIPKNPVAID